MVILHSTNWLELKDGQANSCKSIATAILQDNWSLFRNVKPAQICRCHHFPQPRKFIRKYIRFNTENYVLYSPLLFIYLFIHVLRVIHKSMSIIFLQKIKDFSFKWIPNAFLVKKNKFLNLIYVDFFYFLKC